MWSLDNGDAPSSIEKRFALPPKLSLASAPPELLLPQRPTRQPHFPPPAPHPLSLRVGIWSGQFSGTIAGLERSPPPDDSEATILCGEGRIGGLLTGGSGQSPQTDSTDVTYGTLFYWLLRSVSGPASPTSSSISPRPRCRDLDRSRKDINDASGALKGEDVSFLFLSCFRFYRLLSRSSMRGFVVMALWLPVVGCCLGSSFISLIFLYD